MYFLLLLKFWFQYVSIIHSSQLEWKLYKAETLSIFYIFLVQKWSKFDARLWCSSVAVTYPTFAKPWLNLQHRTHAHAQFDEQNEFKEWTVSLRNNKRRIILWNTHILSMTNNLRMKEKPLRMMIQVWITLRWGLFSYTLPSKTSWPTHVPATGVRPASC